ncbi:DNA helicase RecQ [Granulosicoccus antarcticus]|nr:DNA helicase RecQ [Granulosicoccus antarcticus]
MTSTDALEILQTIYGFDGFRGQQQEIVDTIIRGEDALVLMPTGGGKSLCYQIPSLARPGTGIIVSPLIALMQDQVDALRALNLNAAFINSSMNAQDVARTEQALLDGQIDMLYVAPERLLMSGMLSLLDRCEIALFAIDEAHCVSQWGHDFRKEYMGLSLLSERYPTVPRIALTATADERTRKEIASNLQLTTAASFVSSFDRPNIRYAIGEPVNPRDAMLHFLDTHHEGEAGIVYCLSRKKVEQTAEWLNKQGRTALPYHAGLPAEERQHNQTRFLREDGLIVVATIAFGMGIDKPDVRFVVHLNLPKSVEAYYQETGRAGRDGQPSNAWMAYGLQDVINLRSMMAQSDADEQHKRLENHKLETMLGLAELTTCRRQSLLSYFGDTLVEPCGNCDNCLYPPHTWDATEAARKALSCVYRTGQRFGVTYVVDVLMGKVSERVTRFGHDRQSTFGIGKEYSANEWRNLFRQLIARGLLAVDVEGHGSVLLTESARPVLKGEQTLHLRELVVGEGKKSRSVTRKKKALEDIADNDQPLWNALRSLRKQLSDVAGVPAYIVFNDSTLVDMISIKPRDKSEMASVSGVGQHKLEQYGDDFLDVIREHS